MQLIRWTSLPCYTRTADSFLRALLAMSPQQREVPHRPQKFECSGYRFAYARTFRWIMTAEEEHEASIIPSVFESRQISSVALLWIKTPTMGWSLQAIVRVLKIKAMQSSICRQVHNGAIPRGTACLRSIRCICLHVKSKRSVSSASQVPTAALPAIYRHVCASGLTVKRRDSTVESDGDTGLYVFILVNDLQLDGNAQSNPPVCTYPLGCGASWSMPWPICACIQDNSKRATGEA